jgi:[FeFe] hydrogenase (group B1/B3)
MRKYENQVQKIKAEVLTIVAKGAFEDQLEEIVPKIPKMVNPGPEKRFRCCIYHERAITEERVKMALGGSPDKPQLVEVLESACDQCLIQRYVVTETCRGCLAHHCIQACPVGAIEIHKGKANIDREKCIECGKCKNACPYSAIVDVLRPCRRVCPTGALTIDEYKKAVIDPDKCISCGACVYSCPFGAIQEKSSLVQVIEALRKERPVYGILAPAFATQFDYLDLGQVITALKEIGFKDVIEVALGADFVVINEAEALKEQTEAMTSSCCPGFVNYIHQEYPMLAHHISHVVSPMVATGRLIKSMEEDAVVVFMGPCIAKKDEQKKYPEAIDYVMTFEELAAMLDASGLDLKALPVAPMNNASSHGRRLARVGGLSDGLKHVLQDDSKRMIIGDGIKACDKALKQLKFKKDSFDFLEGMACEGGCIKGPVTMHYGNKDAKAIEAYAKEALEVQPSEAIRIFNKINMNCKKDAE